MVGYQLEKLSYLQVLNQNGVSVNEREQLQNYLIVNTFFSQNEIIKGYAKFSVINSVDSGREEIFTDRIVSATFVDGFTILKDVRNYTYLITTEKGVSDNGNA